MIELVFSGLACTDDEIDTEDHEQCQTEDLKAKTGNHDIDSHILTGLASLVRRYSTTSGLEYQTDDIACDKGQGVRLRLESGDVFAVNNDQTRQTQVDRCR